MSISSATAAPKPLKVYILAGQSNMQGKAGVRTIERLNMTEDSKQMYMDMNVKNGLPSAPKDVYGVYFGGDHMSRKKASPLSVMKGPLKPGYEGEMTSKSTFGPEYTFGIYMQKHLNEPILIVKIAWGGRNLIEQFRPPSAGKYLTLTGKVIGEEKVMDGHGNPIGHYYNTVIKRVNEVLADPGKYHPAYKKADGYEIAGFVWFQGFNDLVGPYPYKDPKQGKKSGKDYSEYSRLLGLFIKDIRKDLKTPKMPFVIGVMGIGGELFHDIHPGPDGVSMAFSTISGLSKGGMAWHGPVCVARITVLAGGMAIGKKMFMAFRADSTGVMIITFC